MARIEAGIYAILSADANIVGQVSNRIYPSYLPQDCPLPAVSFWRISTIREQAMYADPNRATVRIQVSVWATTAYSAGTIAEYVRAALHRKIGLYGGVQITDLAIENEITTYDYDTEEHQVAIDFMVQHVET